MNFYEIPEDKRCQVCNARMPDPESWLCGSCGASQTPEPRPGGIRGFLAELYQLKAFVIFLVVLIALVIVLFASGWGNQVVRGPFWMRQ